MKASKPHGIKKLKRSDDALLMIDRIPDIIGIDDSVCRRDNDPETWHVQVFTYKISVNFEGICWTFMNLSEKRGDHWKWLVKMLISRIRYGFHQHACQFLQIFRSIDSNSVKGFPKDPKEATAKARK